MKRCFIARIEAVAALALAVALTCLPALAAAQTPPEQIHSDALHVSFTMPTGWFIQTKDVPKSGLFMFAPSTNATEKPDSCGVTTGDPPKHGPNGEVLTQALINSDLRPVPIAVWLEIFDHLGIRAVTSMQTNTPYLVDGVAVSSVQATQDASGKRLYYQQATFMTPSIIYTIMCLRQTGLPARMETNGYRMQIETEFEALMDSFRIDR